MSKALHSLLGKLVKSNTHANKIGKACEASFMVVIWELIDFMAVTIRISKLAGFASGWVGVFD
jgi:hypothetical protein